MKQPDERLFLQRQIEKHGKKYSLLQPIEYLMAGHIYGTGKMLIRNEKAATINQFLKSLKELHATHLD